MLSTNEVYSWNVRAFGVGIAQNYALIIVKEVSELHDVIARRESGDLQAWSRFRAELGTEIGDVVIASTVMGGFEGLDMADAVADITTTGEHLAFAGVGPRTLADRLVAEAGRVARAVLKRDEGIRESPEFWRGEIGEALAALVYGASCLAPWFDLVADDAISSRWADVSGRDWTEHRPPSPGGLGYAPEQIEATKAAARDASLDPEPDRGIEDGADDAERDPVEHCPACIAGTPEGHSCALQVTPLAVRQAALSGRVTPIDAWPRETPEITPEVALERAARATSRGALPRCVDGRPGCRNRISRDVVAEAPESDQARRCAHCRADGARIGDAVMVNAAAEATHCSRWWPGHVAQIGPAAAVHGLDALAEEDVRVVLTPQVWLGGDGQARPLPGGGVVVVKRELRAHMLAVDDTAARAAAERALPPLTVGQWEGVERPVRAHGQER